MLKKEIAVLMVICTVFLSGCVATDNRSSDQGASNISSNPVTMQPVNNKKNAQSERENITWSSENNEVTMVPIKKNKYGTPEVVSVEINGVKKEFYWTVAEEPRIFYTDVTHDSKPEAVIITNIGRGTGVSIDELHVLNSEDLSEIKFPGYEQIAADYMESYITKKDSGKLEIKVTALGKDYAFSYEVDSGIHVQDKLFFGGTVIFALKDQKITLNLPGSIGISPIYICDFPITYKFDSSKNEFVVDQIKVEPYDSM